MTILPDEATFFAFLERHASSIRRISGGTRGEWSPSDVRNEAWIFAAELGEKQGYAVDLENPETVSNFLAYLYNHCVRYTERIVRNASKLDHSPDEDADGPHWLTNSLAADDGAHPGSLLELIESETPEPDDPSPNASRAAAWLHLLIRFDNSIRLAAAFLLISPSWCNECLRRVVRTERMQLSLPQDGSSRGHESVELRPWRKFKIPGRQSPEQTQAALNFWDTPDQPKTGQLWLL